MTGPLVQNFSINAGDPVRVNIDVNPDTGVSLIPGVQIFWTAFKQRFGVPVTTEPPAIRKVLDAGIEIDDPDTLTFHVDLDAADSIDLLGNYYHETVIQSVAGDKLTVNCGEVTVLFTATRDLTI